VRVAHAGGLDLQPTDVSLADDAGLIGFFNTRDLVKVETSSAEPGAPEAASDQPDVEMVRSADGHWQLRTEDLGRLHGDDKDFPRRVRAVRKQVHGS